MSLFRKPTVKAEITKVSDAAMESLRPEEKDPETIYMEEGVREANAVLFPNPEEVDSRIPLITRLSGKPNDIRMMARARVVLAIRRAIDEQTPIDWDQLDIVGDLLGLSVSLGGKGRSEAVELGRRTPPPEKKKGLWGI
jgi:hypothetical protein